MELVGRYIQHGQPIGSKLLAERCRLDVSAATIRNVMAELERQGYLAAPHTSAGRVPTAQGYRFFVDSMVTLRRMPGATVDEIQTTLSAQAATRETVAAASGLLSDMTNLVGVVSVPGRERFAFRQIDFVPMNDRQVLVIIVFEDGEVQNRIIQTDRAYDRAELERAANLLNAEFAGLTTQQIQTRLVGEMANARQQMDAIMQSAIAMAQASFGRVERKDVVVSGQTNLMGCQELADVRKLKALFDAIAHKTDILHLLDRCVRAEGVRLFIGEESGNDALDDVSLVSAPYTVGGEVIGVVGVIGPTRMAYDRVISLVDTTAKALSGALNAQQTGNG